MCPNIWVGLLISCGIILAENVVPHDGMQHYISHVTDQTSRTGRFGLTHIDELRKNICQTLCTSAIIPYPMSLMCVVKCPELYLPHGTTTECPTSTSTSAPPLPPPGPTTTTTSTTTTTTTTTTTPSPNMTMPNMTMPNMTMPNMTMPMMP